MAASLVPFALLCAALIIGYYLLLPDGSAVHAGYLSLEPSSLAHRTGDALAAFGAFFPFFILPAPLEQLALPVLAILAVFGARRLGWSGLLLALYSAGHLLLVILFPYSGGQRYYLPILFAVAVLAAAGVESLVRRAAVKWSMTGDPRVAGTLIALLFVGAIVSNFYRIDRRDERAIDGPYSPAATEMFEYVREQPGSIQPVAFFNPRALRLLVGKQAILVRDTASASKVNSIAIFREPHASRWQLSPEQVAALRDFQPTFRNDRFTFYVRASRAADAAADGPGAVRRH
jgi:hypothetical protein